MAESLQQRAARCLETGSCACECHEPVGVFRCRHRSTGTTITVPVCAVCLELETAWDHTPVNDPGQQGQLDLL